ncbi:MAG: hypothetical protein HAW67_03820 [Endozoicomonadaceae bacterium]|nr:hypothetical protein [Endozoicomonadaceae bacterium]
MDNEHYDKIEKLFIDGGHTVERKTYDTPIGPQTEALNIFSKTKQVKLLVRPYFDENKIQIMVWHRDPSFGLWYSIQKEYFSYGEEQSLFDKYKEEL